MPRERRVGRTDALSAAGRTNEQLRCAMAVNLFITPTVLLAFPDFVSDGEQGDIVLHDAWREVGLRWPLGCGAQHPVITGARLREVLSVHTFPHLNRQQQTLTLN